MFNRADLTVGGGKKLSRTYLIDKFQIKKKYDRKRYMDCKASSKITFV